MPRKALNVAGKRFGRAIAISPVRDGVPQLRWKCKCDCGKEFLAVPRDLVSGTTRGCHSCSRRKHNNFWDRVSVRGNNECWLWTGTINSFGYGATTVSRRPYPAHRMAYEITFGKLPKGIFACHHCDNPPCCNPAHLFAGTHQDNMDDKVRKGRQPNRFNGSVRAKLTGSQFDIFKSRVLAGEKPFSIAKHFGIHGATACKIAKQLFSK